MSDAYAIIRHAIATKTNVSARYLGHERELSPHAIGTKRGRPQVLCLQVGGGSNGGLKADPDRNWRCLPVDELSNVRPSDSEWQTASNYSLPHPCIDEMDLSAR